MLKWWPLLWSNLWRRPTRTLLTALSVLATFVLFGLLDSFRDAVATYGDDYANALVVQSRDTRLPYSHVTRLLSMPGVIAACGVLITPARLPSEKRSLIQGVQDPALFAVHPGIRLSPEALSAWRRDRTAVLIGADVAATNGWRAGDRLILPGLPRGPKFQRPDGRNVLEVVVAGSFTAENPLAAQGILAHYEYLRDLVGPERAGMEYIGVRLAPGEKVDSLRTRIDAEFQSSPAPVKTYSARALLRAYYGTYRELARLAGVVIIVSAVTLLLIAGSVLVHSQLECSPSRWRCCLQSAPSWRQSTRCPRRYLHGSGPSQRCVPWASVADPQRRRYLSRRCCWECSAQESAHSRHFSSVTAMDWPF